MYHTLLTTYYNTVNPPSIAELAYTLGYNIHTLRSKANILGLSPRVNKLVEYATEGKLDAIIDRDPCVNAWFTSHFPHLVPKASKPPRTELSLFGDTSNLASALLINGGELTNKEFAAYHGFNLATVQTYAAKYSAKALRLAKYLPPANDVILRRMIAIDPQCSLLLAKMVDHDHSTALLMDLRRSLLADKVEAQELIARQRQVAATKTMARLQELRDRDAKRVLDEEAIEAAKVARKEESRREENELTMHHATLAKIFANIKDRPLHKRQIERVAERVGTTTAVVLAYEKVEKETDTLDPNAVDYYYQREGNYSLAATARHFNVPRSVILTCVGQED